MHAVVVQVHMVVSFGDDVVGINVKAHYTKADYSSLRVVIPIATINK